MSELPKPPQAFQDFAEQYPKLADAWRLTQDAEREGPLDERQVRLLKLAVAIGAMRTGSIRSGLRKALALGIPKEELRQVIALAAGTIGFPSTVAVHSWASELLDE